MVHISASMTARRPPHRLLHVLLVLGFVLAQSFAVVHATRHELAATGDRTPCETCAIAHAAGGLPFAVPSAPAFLIADEAPRAAAIEAVVLRSRERPRSRAPPVSLA